MESEIGMKTESSEISRSRFLRFFDFRLEVTGFFSNDFTSAFTVSTAGDLKSAPCSIGVVITLNGKARKSQKTIPTEMIIK